MSLRVRSSATAHGRRRRRLFAALGVACAAWAGAAMAHAPPEADGIAWYDGSAADTMVIRTNRGFLVDTGTGEFRYLCREALDLLDGEAAPMAFGSDGSLVVAAELHAIMRTPGDFCDWFPASSPLTDRRGFHLAASPVPGTFYLVTADLARTDNFFRTTDDGVTWALVESNDASFTRVAVAPSDGQRIYRGGSTVDPVTGYQTLIAASSDGGVTWTETALPVPSTVLQHFLVAVHPADPDRVFVRAQALSTGEPEQLLASADAGATFSVVLTAPDLLAFAATAAGDRVWVGASDGLYRSDDGGQTFSHVASAALSRITCLSARGSELFACANQGDELGVSVSSDGGQTFTRFLHFSDVVDRIECSSPSRGGDSCDSAFQEWQLEVLQPVIVDAGMSSSGSGGSASGGMGPGGAGATTSGGGDADGGIGASGGATGNGTAIDTGESTPSDDGGCSCTLRATPARPGAAAALALLLGLSVLRRRRSG